ncbi:porin [Snodgrassella sp.]|uniref:porin n=1 Tax=Snodgrassella sp. TaxID=2815304 RepID=UPI00258630F8|nr:porin [Snodgrassella sp.]MCO6506796.1 porin [Snodgrassella sp.]MCO6519245.1 porin [Snodgrassella sp.]
MKKTLIALALTTLPVAAMAEVVLYGQMKAGYEVNSSKVTGEDRSPYLNGIADYGSRIGFKGSEDLGNGLKAIWQVESAIHLGNSNGKADGWANRDSFIGLQHDKFGTVRAGRISNAINANMDVVDAWEYNSDTLGLGKFTRTDARYVGIAYDSPEWAGFNFNVLYSPRDNVNGGNRAGEYATGIGSGDKYSFGLNYKNSGFYAKYGFDYLKNSAVKIDEYSIIEDEDTDEVIGWTGRRKDGQVHRIEGGYDANNLFVAVGYQYTKNATSYSKFIDEVNDYVKIKALGVGDHNTTIDNQGQEAALTVGYHFGNVFPKISYAHGWDVKVNGTKEKNTKYDQIVLGADYDFSKRTTANVQAGWLREGLGEDEGKIKTTAFGVGLKHTF